MTLILLPLAGFSSAFSMVLALETRDPQLSQELYRALPSARTHIADQVIAQHFASAAAVSSSTEGGDAIRAEGPSAILPLKERQGIEAGALAALQSTPYSSAALRQLAVVERDPSRKAALLALSQRVSRRDPVASAQLAQLHLANGRPVQGLAALDQALSVSQALDGAIFPLLLEAARSPELKAPFAAILRRDPVWGERLAVFASADADHAARFARIARHFPVTSPVRTLEHGSRMVDLLADARRPEEAFVAYSAFSPTAPDASAFGTRPLAPVDWRLIDRGDVGARVFGLHGAGQEPQTEITAKAGRSGEIAHLLASLSQGAHELVLTNSTLERPGARLSLEQACIIGGQEWNASRTTADLQGERVQIAFEVPPDCPFQLLRLSVDAPGGAVRATVHSVRLARVTGAAS